MSDSLNEDAVRLFCDALGALERLQDMPLSIFAKRLDRLNRIHADLRVLASNIALDKNGAPPWGDLCRRARDPVAITKARTYNVKDVAEILGVHPETVRRLVNLGALQSCAGIRHIKVSHTELNRYLSGGKML